MREREGGRERGREGGTDGSEGREGGREVSACIIIFFLLLRCHKRASESD